MFLRDHPFLHEEFDWAAADVDGSIGYFATAGLGPIPTTVLRDAAAFDDLFSKVERLPDIATAIPASRFDRDIGEWMLVARKGIYAFDWRDESSTYEVIARPTIPLSLVALADAGLRTAAQNAVLTVSLRTASRLVPD